MSQLLKTKLRTSSSTRNICSSATRQHQRWRKTNCMPGSGYFAYLSALDDIVIPPVYYTGSITMSSRMLGHRRLIPLSTSSLQSASAPVPNVHETDSVGNWRYYPLDQLPTEFSGVSQREVDDFCPVVRLNALIQSQGEPNLHTYKDTKGNLCTPDTSQTWQTTS